MIDVPKLTRELEQAGIPIDGCSSNGRIDFKPEATQQQRDQAAAILAAHDPNTLLPENQAVVDDMAAAKTGSVQTILTQIAAGRAQIVTDLSDLQTAAGSLQAATTFAEMKIVIASIMTIEQHLLNRQDSQLLLEDRLIHALARLADRFSL